MSSADFFEAIPVAHPPGSPCGQLRNHVLAGPNYVTPYIRFLFVVPYFWIGLPPHNTSRCCSCPSPNLRLCFYLIHRLALC